MSTYSLEVGSGRSTYSRRDLQTRVAMTKEYIAVFSSSEAMVLGKPALDPFQSKPATVLLCMYTHPPGSKREFPFKPGSFHGVRSEPYVRTLVIIAGLLGRLDTVQFLNQVILQLLG